MSLKENYKDDILDTSQNTKRKYNLTENSDGTISLDDVTEYLQQGDSFGADDINDTNKKVNDIEGKLTASDDLVFDFTKSGSEYGYKDANGNFVPFSSASSDAEHISFDNTGTGMTSTNVQTAIVELKNYVGDGKTLVANAITAKGQTVATTASFQTMADKIGNLKPSTYINPSGNKAITANGTGIDVKAYATASVTVPTQSVANITRNANFNPNNTTTISGLTKNDVYVCAYYSQGSSKGNGAFTISSGGTTILSTNLTQTVTHADTAIKTNLNLHVFKATATSITINFNSTGGSWDNFMILDRIIR